MVQKGPAEGVAVEDAVQVGAPGVMQGDAGKPAFRIGAKGAGLFRAFAGKAGNAVVDLVAAGGNAKRRG